MSDVLKILFLGDIVGASGRESIRQHLPSLKKEHSFDLIIANCENAAHGFGITPQVAKEIQNLGVDVMTGGNHTWDKKEAIQVFQEWGDRVLRPANCPLGTPGRGSTVVHGKSGHKIGIINVMGRIFMDPLDCPFMAAKRELQEVKRETSIILVDIRAEATSEKMALTYFLDGEVSAVVGTHTHVQTGDERVFPKGTGYLSDAGMNGAMDSIIGMKKEIIIDRFTKKMPFKMEVADGPGQVNGVIFSIDPHNGKCQEVDRVRILP